MKKVRSFLLLFFMISSLLVLNSCSVEPYAVKWYWQSYVLEDGTSYEVGFDRYDHFNSINQDVIELTFNEDKTFYFKSYTGNEYNGTYTYKNNLGDTDVSLKFLNGTEASGICFAQVADGKTYRASFKIFGVTYFFRDINWEFDLDYYIKDTIKNLVHTYHSKKSSGYYSRSFDYGYVEKKESSYYVTIDDETFIIDDYKKFIYSFNKEELKMYNSIKDGYCALRYDESTKKIAIYYYDNQQFDFEASYKYFSGDFKLEFEMLYDNYPNETYPNNYPDHLKEIKTLEDFPDNKYLGSIEYANKSYDISILWKNGTFEIEELDQYSLPLGNKLTGTYTFFEKDKVLFDVIDDTICSNLSGKNTTLIISPIEDREIKLSQIRNVQWTSTHSYNSNAYISLNYKITNQYNHLGIGTLSFGSKENDYEIIRFVAVHMHDEYFDIYEFYNYKIGELLLSGYFVEYTDDYYFEPTYNITMFTTYYSESLYFLDGDSTITMSMQKIPEENKLF